MSSGYRNVPFFLNWRVMAKIFGTIVTIIGLLAAMIGIVGAFNPGGILYNNPALRTPVINLEDQDDLLWTSISDVENYEVHITNSLSETQIVEVSINRYSYNLLPVGNFTLQIKAIPTEESNKVFSESIPYTLFKLPSLDVSFDYETQRIIFNQLSRTGESIQYEIANDANSTPYALTGDNFFNTTALSPGIYTRSIRAKSNNLNTIRSNYSQISFVTGLNPTVSNQTLSWSSLSSFSGVTFDVFNSTNRNQPIISNVGTNFIDLFDSRIPVGTNSLVLKVNSSNLSINYPYSKTVAITKTGDIEMNYNAVNRSISWSESTSATGYKIDINGITLHQNYSSSLGRMIVLPIFTEPKLNEITITPLNSNINTITKTFNAYVLGGVTPQYTNETSELNWENLTQMTYQIYIGEDPVFKMSTNVSKIDLTTLNFTPGEVILRIKYISTNLNNEKILHAFSDSITLNKLSQVVISNYDKVNLSWTTTEVGARYRVIVSELDIDEIVNSPLFPLAYTQGSKNIQIITLKNGNFIPSNETLFSLNLTKLETPTGSITTQLDGRFRITVNVVPNATNYIGAIYYFNTLEQYNSNTPFLTESLNLTNSSNFISKFPPNYAMVVELNAQNINTYEFIDSNQLRMEKLV
jgi:hypothetical protein